jgi:hypothetical protein
MAETRRPWMERRMDAIVLEWTPGTRPLTVPMKNPMTHPMRIPATTTTECRQKGIKPVGWIR